MEDLLRNDYTSHYRLQVATITDIYQETNDDYFEIEDTINGIQISNVPNSGTAVYNNPNRFLVSVINYERFVDSLPHAFRRGIKKCDLIVYTRDSNGYFLLNEITSTNPEYDRRKAIDQLKQSLINLVSVPTIRTFADSFIERRCCFFNKQVQSPSIIPVTRVFNQVNAIAPIVANGLQVHNTDMERLGFTFYKYYAGDRLTLS